MKKIGGGDVLIQATGLIFLDLDPDQVAREIVALREPVQRLAAKILLRHLPLERDAVASVLCHGLSSFENPAARSIPNPASVHPEGPTPDIVPNGTDQLWVADLTYVAMMGGFVYVAIILDAWSRRVFDYALCRLIGARLTIAALRAAIERRRPAPGPTHHMERGSQYAAEAYRKVLYQPSLIRTHGLIGSVRWT